MSQAALKVARRLQSLPDKQTYTIQLTKCGELWLLAVVESQKIEVLR